MTPRQAATARCAAIAAIVSTHSSGGRDGLGLREQHAKRGARPWRRLYLNLAVVHLHGPVDHREANPAASLLRCEIEIENALQVFGRDADACVGERHRHAMAPPALAAAAT